MTTSREILDAIISGNAIDVKSTMDTVIQTKIGPALETMKLNLAQNLISPKENYSENENI